MCKGSNPFGFIGSALGTFFGGPIGGLIGGMIGGALGGSDQAATPQPVAPAPNPAADQAAAQDTARSAATARRRALGAGSPRSLLATMGGALGDTTPAQIGTATAAPVTKSALGA